MRRIFLTAVIAAAACVAAAEPLRELVTVNGERRDAELVALSFNAASPSESTARAADGAEMEAGDLVRWGTPVAPRRGLWLRLHDGSLLTATDDWTTQSRLRIDAGSVAVRRDRGWIEFPRTDVAAVVFEGFPPAAVSGDRSGAVSQDRVTLKGESEWQAGDRLDGELLGVAETQATLSILGAETAVELERIARIDFATPSPTGQAASGCLVGLSDGSLVVADAVALNAEEAAFRVAGVTLRESRASVVFVQPLAGPVRYLSDETPRDYRHTPYFDLEWPLGRDETPLGQPLVAGGRRYAKGIATHAAARVIYAVSDSDRRFQADLAIADSAGDEPIGSVVFRVYAIRGGKLEPIYESPVVRGGEPALPIDLDIAGAAGVVLVVDFADNGDAGDDALWLDARFVGG